MDAEKINIDHCCWRRCRPTRPPFRFGQTLSFLALLSPLLPPFSSLHLPPSFPSLLVPFCLCSSPPPPPLSRTVGRAGPLLLFVVLAAPPSAGGEGGGGGPRVGCNKLYLCSALPVSAGSPCLPPRLTHCVPNAFTSHRCEESTVGVCCRASLCLHPPLLFQLLFVGSPQRPRLTVFGIRVNFHEFYCAVAAAGVRSRRDSCAASPPDERRLVYSPANLGCDWDPQTRAARPHIYIKEALFTRFSLHVPPAAFHSKVGNY